MPAAFSQPHTDPDTLIPAGFFGDLLSLVCQSFSMVDMVLLLHGNAQPLSRIQPQLTEFFTEHYLQGREPTDANITVSAADDCCAVEMIGCAV